MSLSVAVHPLVLLSVADHSARSRCQKTPERRWGVLFGTQVGREVAIVATSPMNLKHSPPAPLDIDHADLQSCIKLRKPLSCFFPLLILWS